MGSSRIVMSVGAFCFGATVGYITYRTLVRTEKSNVSDIATVVGAVGGAAVTGLFDPQQSDTFGGTPSGCSPASPRSSCCSWPLTALRRPRPPWAPATSAAPIRPWRRHGTSTHLTGRHPSDRKRDAAD